MILISLSIVNVHYPAGSVPPPSHLTSCTPTKSNLYFDTVTSKPALHKLLIFNVPSLLTIFRHLGSLSKESVQVRGTGKSFVTQPQSWRTTPRRLSAAACSMYSQLFSIAGGRPSNRNPRTRHAVVKGTHLTWRATT
jgi:hypothetical protein